MQREQREVARQQQRPAEVAEGPAAAGDGVALVGRGEVGQPRVVDDRRRAEAEVGHDEQPGAEQVPLVGDEEHRHRGERAEGGERGQQLALGTAPVGDRAGEGEDQHLQDDRQRQDVAEVAARRDADAQRVDPPVGVGGGLGDRGQVRREEDGRHRGVEDRHRPVVGVPAEAFPLQGAVDGDVGGPGSGGGRRSGHARRLSAAGRPVQHRRATVTRSVFTGRRPGRRRRGRRLRRWSGACGRRRGPVRPRPHAAGPARA